jgi:hypothetical protein
MVVMLNKKAGRTENSGGRSRCGNQTNTQADLSGPSRMIERTPRSLAFSKTNLEVEQM